MNMEVLMNLECLILWLSIKKRKDSYNLIGQEQNFVLWALNIHFTTSEQTKVQK